MIYTTNLPTSNNAVKVARKKCVLDAAQKTGRTTYLGR